MWKIEISLKNRETLSLSFFGGGVSLLIIFASRESNNFHGESTVIEIIVAFIILLIIRSDNVNLIFTNEKKMQPVAVHVLQLTPNCFSKSRCLSRQS